MELNKVLLIGNLTRDPEKRETANGTQVCKFDLAVNTRRGKDKDEVLFMRVECWQKLAEIAGQFLKKGSQCLVEGRLVASEYETKDGQKRKEVFVSASDIKLGNKPQAGGQDGDRAPRESAPPRDQSAGGQWESRKATAAPEENRGEAWKGTEDDLPF